MSTASNPEISIVVPVYKSELCVSALVEAVSKAMQGAGLSYELILTDDSSPDRSWQKITDCSAKAEHHIRAQRHRRNFGQDNAIMSGLRVARGKYVVIMDDDLQHDPDDITRLLAKLVDDNLDVVFAAFTEKKNSLWKTMGSWLNGKFAEWLLDKPKDIYLSPFKIVRAEIIHHILQYSGREPYIDGLLLDATRHLGSIRVEHRERFAGDSTYSLGKSIQVWSRLFLSFSVKPLRLGIWMGFIISVLGACATVALVVVRLWMPELFEAEAIGWASTICIVMLLSGVQMFILSVLGEYVGRIFLSQNQISGLPVSDTINV